MKAAESLVILICDFAAFNSLVSESDQSQISNQKSKIQRPLEPDTVSTVEGRNSHLMTVPSFEPKVERFYLGSN